jgi:2,4'-dihydroxyacetophenone dioxygenase
MTERDIDRLPWQPVRPGYDLKVLRGSDSDDDPRILLLRLDPGEVITRHRHSGEIHAINLVGSRKLLDTGEVVGPGGYVYEPPGNEDSWMAVGAVPLVVFVVACGAIESLDERGRVIARTTTRSVTESYRRFVAARPEATHAGVRSARR